MIFLDLAVTSFKCPDAGVSGLINFNFVDTELHILTVSFSSELLQENFGLLCSFTPENEEIVLNLEKSRLISTVINHNLNNSSCGFVATGSTDLFTSLEVDNGESEKEDEDPCCNYTTLKRYQANIALSHCVGAQTICGSLTVVISVLSLGGDEPLTSVAKLQPPDISLLDDSTALSLTGQSMSSEQAKCDIGVTVGPEDYVDDFIPSEESSRIDSGVHSNNDYIFDNIMRKYNLQQNLLDRLKEEDVSQDFDVSEDTLDVDIRSFLDRINVADISSSSLVGEVPDASVSIESTTSDMKDPAEGEVEEVDEDAAVDHNDQDGQDNKKHRRVKNSGVMVPNPSNVYQPNRYHPAAVVHQHQHAADTRHRTHKPRTSIKSSTSRGPHNLHATTTESDQHHCKSTVASRNHRIEQLQGSDQYGVSATSVAVASVHATTGTILHVPLSLYTDALVVSKLLYVGHTGDS